MSEHFGNKLFKKITAWIELVITPFPFKSTLNLLFVLSNVTIFYLVVQIINQGLILYSSLFFLSLHIQIIIKYCRWDFLHIVFLSVYFFHHSCQSSLAIIIYHVGYCMSLLLWLPAATISHFQSIVHSLSEYTFKNANTLYRPA